MNGKIVGVFLGAFLAGPIGLFIGLFFGYLHDTGALARWCHRVGLPFYRRSQNSAQQVFFDCTFSVMGYMAKADGRISEQEIAAAERVMTQLGLHGERRQAAIAQFDRGKRHDFNLSAALIMLKQACWRHPSLLRTFLEIQTQIAHADGMIGPQKQAVLDEICRGLGLFNFNFDQFWRAYGGYAGAQSSQGRSYRRPGASGPTASLSDAYAVLGVSASASDAEVKKAYRRLMSKNHPDKLVSKGLPPEMIKLATQKTQRIKEAYELICASR